jgi:hypothetical protein
MAVGHIEGDANGLTIDVDRSFFLGCSAAANGGIDGREVCEREDITLAVDGGAKQDVL